MFSLSKWTPIYADVYTVHIIYGLLQLVENKTGYIPDFGALAQLIGQQGHTAWKKSCFNNFQKFTFEHWPNVE